MEMNRDADTGTDSYAFQRNTELTRCDIVASYAPTANIGAETFQTPIHNLASQDTETAHCSAQLGPPESLRVTEADATQPDGLLSVVTSRITLDASAIHGTGPANTRQKPATFSAQPTLDSSQIGTQLLQEHEFRPLRTAQDSSMFMPILAKSSASRRVQQPVGLVESRPQLSSHEPRRPLSPDLAVVSDSELELNRLPLTPTDVAPAVSRQQSVASQASHTSRVSHQTQASHHSYHSATASAVEALNLAHKLADNLTMMTTEQRRETADRDRLAAEREKLLLQESAERERLATESERALRIDALEREKLQVQQTSNREQAEKCVQ